MNVCCFPLPCKLFQHLTLSIAKKPYFYHWICLTSADIASSANLTSSVRERSSPLSIVFSISWVSWAPLSLTSWGLFSSPWIISAAVLWILSKYTGILLEAWKPKSNSSISLNVAVFIKLLIFASHSSPPFFFLLNTPKDRINPFK